MTPQERKVMELALQALTHGGCPPDCKDGLTDSGGVHPWGEAALIPCPNCQTITAIKEALAQTDQEPVAWVDEYGNAFPLAAKQYSIVGKHWKPLYTTPPHRPWVGLSKEEKRQFVVGYFSLDCDRRIAIALMDDYEAYLKEKNT